MLEPNCNNQSLQHFISNSLWGDVNGGTSMATPHASGVAALYWSYNLSFTNKQVAYMLLRFADDLGTPGWDKFYGYGRVDAYPQDG